MRLSLIIAFAIFHGVAVGQRPGEKDSLLNVIRNAPHDTVKITALCRLSWVIQQPETRAESSRLANEALALARKAKWEKGEALAFMQLGGVSTGYDHANALEYYLKALKIFEKLKSDEHIAGALSNIGNIYRHQGDLQIALDYLLKADALFGNNLWRGRVNNFNLLGQVYERLGKTDSALVYFNRGYEIGHLDALYLMRILRGLGNVYAARGETDLAFSFYRKSIGNAKALNRRGENMQTYVQLSKLFTQSGNRDSAIYYAQEAVNLGYPVKSVIFVNAAKQLASLYEGINDKEALRYYKLSAETRDSLFDAENQAHVQSLTFSEQERQREMALAKQLEAEERKHNLQYAAIAFGIVIFVILFFLLSHSIIANPKWIRFFGVLALLIFFEFLNLLLHPYLGALTHHSPVLMLLIMVCIAALLVPLHHRLEHWITHQMIEKNNRIRLAAAKKTIAQLEGKADAHHQV